MAELSRFQDAFAEALKGGFAPLAPWAGEADAETRFSVYRNTVAKGCADALAAQFPSILRIVGEAWMREAGVRFAREHPPASPSLLAYGAAFPDWLAAFEPAADMPWLPDLARIDWAWNGAYFAGDAPPLARQAFAGLGPDLYCETAVELHPAAQLLWFGASVPSLWRALQGAEAPAAVELAAEPEGLLLTRPGLEVEARTLGPGAHAFLTACQRSASLAAAGAAALAAEPTLALAEIFAELIAAGAFARLRPLGPTPESAR